MPKYLFVYHGGKKPESSKEVEEVMAKWGAWLGGMGAAALDPGNPVGMSKTVFANKVTDSGGANPASGYGVIEAATMDTAIAQAKGCPILEAGGNVEIAEIIEM